MNQVPSCAENRFCLTSLPLRNRKIYFILLVHFHLDIMLHLLYDESPPFFLLQAIRILFRLSAFSVWSTSPESITHQYSIERELEGARAGQIRDVCACT